MELQIKKKMRVVCNMLAILAVSTILCACPGSKEDPVPPSLSLNPLDLNFEGAKGITQSFEIKTDASWKVSHTPNWLSPSSFQGTGTTTLTLTTTKDNETSVELSDVVEVVATNEAGSVNKTITVKQVPGVETECYARVNETNLLRMSYGMACVVDYGNNTSYFYYCIYTAEEFEMIKGNNDQIVQEATKTGSKWKRQNVPSSGGIEITDNSCQPNKNYVFVTIAYAQNGKRGDISITAFSTKSTEEQPLVSVTPQKNVVKEVLNGNSGTYYKWDAKKENGVCEGYITYVCVGSSEFPTMKNRTGEKGTYDQHDGIDVAWNIWLERKKGEETHETSFNKDSYGCREKLFTLYKNDAPNSFEYRNTDKYLQIVVWGVGNNNEPSGIICDYLYTVENGVLKEVDNPAPSWNLTLSTSSLIVESSTGNQQVNVTSNDDWKASSNQNWCAVSPSSGSNNGVLTISVSENTTNTPRSAKVTVTGNNSGLKAVLDVTQKGNNPTPDPDNVDPNATVQVDFFVSYVDGIVTSWNFGSTASTFDYIVYKKESAEKLSDSELVNDFYDETKAYSIAQYGDYNFKITDSDWFTEGTEYYLCAVAKNSSGVRGPVLRYLFKTRSVSMPYAEISNVKAASTTKWTYDIAMKNNAKSYYLATSTDEDNYTKDWHWYAYYVYYWAASGELSTYDWTSVQTTLNSGTCNVITICTWGVDANKSIGNCAVAYGNTSSSSRTAKARSVRKTSGLKKEMMPKSMMMKSKKNTTIYQIN